MKAKEAAKKAAEQKLSCKEVKQLMPSYRHELHKRQWIANFLKSLPDHLRVNYDELKT